MTHVVESLWGCRNSSSLLEALSSPVENVRNGANELVRMIETMDRINASYNVQPLMSQLLHRSIREVVIELFD